MFVPLQASLRRLVGAGILLAMAGVSASCVVMPTNTERDQRRSLAKYDSIGINAPVRLPELEDEADSGFAAADFLTLHSGLIVSGEYIDEDFKRKLETSRASAEGVLELGFSVPIAETGSGFGSCAPVTADGYFLTATHVLSNEEGSYVLYATSDDRKTYIDYAPLRVVHRNDEVDFAIVKAEMPTPRHLDYRRESLTEDTILFGGGWMHARAGGVFLEGKPISAGGEEFRKIMTSLPMIKGDSGSPLIDREGRLCGILSTLRLGVIVKLKPKSTAVMMDPERIEEIIERDRAEH